MNRTRILTALIILLTFSCTSNKAEEEDSGMDGTGVADGDSDVDSDGDGDSDADTDVDATVDSAADVDAGGDASDDGCKWRTIHTRPNLIFSDIWGRSELDLYAAGYYPSTAPGFDASPVILHLEDGVWKLMPVEARDTYLEAVSGNGEGDVFCGGSYGVMYHFDGTEWNLNNSDQYTFDIWGSTGPDVFSIGRNADDPESGTINHYDGDAWTNIYYGIVIPAGVWGTSITNVYSVGIYNALPLSGRILLYDGSEWKETEIKGALSAIWGDSESDIFVAGNEFLSEDAFEYGDGFIMHFNGDLWSYMKEDFPEVLDKIHGSSGDDVYVNGTSNINGSVVYHYDGNNWSKMRLEDSWTIASVWATGRNEAFAVGKDEDSSDGMILHYSCE